MYEALTSLLQIRVILTLSGETMVPANGGIYPSEDEMEAFIHYNNEFIKNCRDTSRLIHNARYKE